MSDPIDDDWTRKDLIDEIDRLRAELEKCKAWEGDAIQLGQVVDRLRAELAE